MHFNINGKLLQHFLELQKWWAWRAPWEQQMEQDHEYQWECLPSFSNTLACAHNETICLEKPLHGYLGITWSTTEMESKTCPLSACLALWLGASPLCCGGLGSQEFTSKKEERWIWLRNQNKNPESVIERAQNHLDISKGSYRKKCTFSFHELKYECFLQSLLGNNPSLLSLLCWAYTETAEFSKSCCLAPRNLPFS